MAIHFIIDDVQLRSVTEIAPKLASLSVYSDVRVTAQKSGIVWT